MIAFDGGTTGSQLDHVIARLEFCGRKCTSRIRGALKGRFAGGVGDGHANWRNRAIRHRGGDNEERHYNAAEYVLHLQE
jgi:hypothetical protein